MKYYNYIQKYDFDTIFHHLEVKGNEQAGQLSVTRRTLSHLKHCSQIIKENFRVRVVTSRAASFFILLGQAFGSHLAQTSISVIKSELLKPMNKKLYSLVSKENKYIYIKQRSTQIQRGGEMEHLSQSSLGIFISLEFSLLKFLQEEMGGAERPGHRPPLQFCFFLPSLDAFYFFVLAYFTYQD